MIEDDHHCCATEIKEKDMRKKFTKIIEPQLDKIKSFIDDKRAFKFYNFTEAQGHISEHDSHCHAHESEEVVDDRPNFVGPTFVKAMTYNKRNKPVSD